MKKRFPSLTHLSEAGIITEQESKIIQDLDAKCIQASQTVQYVSMSNLGQTEGKYFLRKPITNIQYLQKSLFNLQHAKYWITLVWAGAIVQGSCQDLRITYDPFSNQSMGNSIQNFSFILTAFLSERGRREESERTLPSTPSSRRSTSSGRGVECSSAMTGSQFR